MANFDFLAGADLGAGGMQGRLPEQLNLPPAPVQTTGVGAQIGAALQDPNILQTLGGLGAGLAAGQPFGQAAGTAAQTLARNRALQAAAAQQSGRQAQITQALIDALAGRGGFQGRMVGPPEDTATANKITMTPTGTTVEFPTTGVAKPFEDVTDRSLEAQATQAFRPGARRETEALPFR